MRRDFSSAFLKLERAEHHIDHFKTIVGSYVTENLNALQPVENADQWDPRILGGRLPSHTPTVVGDAIHNLRTSLDHAYCALVESNGGNISRHTTFPFHKRQVDAEGSLKGIKQQGAAPSDAAIDAIVNHIQPFEGSDIYGVHALDIADKHHVLIPTEAVIRITGLDFLNPDGTPTGGGLYQLTMVCDYGDLGGAVGLGGGIGARLHGDPAETFDICFADGQPFAGESIAKTLTRLHGVTKDAITALAPF